MTDDELEVEIQDFLIEEVHELLADRGTELSPLQAAALVQFIAQAGSIEAAQELLGRLSQQPRAA
jgi:hypothetical protein